MKSKLVERNLGLTNGGLVAYSADFVENAVNKCGCVRREGVQCYSLRLL